jgi:hypothetical protein
LPAYQAVAPLRIPARIISRAFSHPLVRPSFLPGKVKIDRKIDVDRQREQVSVRAIGMAPQCNPF